MTTTVRQALDWAESVLETADIHPADREARWLLECVLDTHVSSSMLLPETCMRDPYLSRFRELVTKRAEHYPLQYLLGTVEFAGTCLQVNTDVLIPRPETEYLVELLLEKVKDQTVAITCADLGTGSGCLAIALAQHLPASRWYAGDISEPALSLARRNAEYNHVADRIQFFRGSWFDAFPPGIHFDCIVTNPPYVSPDEHLSPEVMHEPHHALFCGQNGYEAYQSIVQSLPERLKPGGIFMGEIGLNQEDRLLAIARNAGFSSCECEKDLTGRIRYLVVHG
jgi:release factor glutamine methyltransferase